MKSYKERYFDCMGSGHPEKLLALSLIIISIYSCTVKDLLSGNEDKNRVGFSLKEVNATRSAIATKDNLLSFGVFCALTTGGSFSSSSTPNYMYNQGVIRSTANDPWSYSPKKYWPDNASDKLSFFAYAPYGCAGVSFSASTTTGVPQLTYTTPTAVADQQDLLIADQQLNKYQTTDGVVGFLFKHSLTAITFQVRRSSPNQAGTELYLTGISIESIHDTGTAPMQTPAAWSNQSGTATFALSAADMALTGPVSTSFTTVNSSDRVMMLIPQQLPTNATLKATFEVRNIADGTVSRVVEKQLKLADLIPVLEASKRYNFRLDYNDNLVLTYSVADWNEMYSEISDDGSYSLNTSTRKFTLFNDIATKGLLVSTSYTGPWTVTSDQNWISIAENINDAGTQSYTTQGVGEKKLYVKFTSAVSGSTRQGTIMVTAGNITIPIAVNEYSIPQTSNCFIINPSSTDITYLSVPIANAQIFWNSSSYGVTDAEKAANALSFDSSDPWIVGVIWQDSQGLASEGTINADAITLLSDSGTGGGPDKAFTLRIPAGLTKRGNFVVALVKGIDKPELTTEEVTLSSLQKYRILWSWHFWVTDYNPYDSQKTEIDWYDDAGNQIPWAFKVPGGLVHRLRGDIWNSDYSQSFLLDRPIGAMDLTGSNVMAYQYGRKDPFPMEDIPLYKTDGSNVIYSNDANSIKGTKTVSWSVMNPLKFISKGFNWADDDVINNSVWNDPTLNGTDILKRSIFDPSPEGFTLPVSGAWSYITDNRNNASLVNIGIQDKTQPSTIQYTLTPNDFNNGFTILSKGNRYFNNGRNDWTGRIYIWTRDWESIRNGIWLATFSVLSERKSYGSMVIPISIPK